MQLTSKRGTITRTIHNPAPTVNIAAEQAQIDRQEFQLALDLREERRRQNAMQEAKDFRDMQRFMRHEPKTTDLFGDNS